MWPMEGHVTLSVGAYHRCSANGDIVYLSCHVSLQDHMSKESYGVTGGNSQDYFTTLKNLVAIDIAIWEIW